MHKQIKGRPLADCYTLDEFLAVRLWNFKYLNDSFLLQISTQNKKEFAALLYRSQSRLKMNLVSFYANLSSFYLILL